MPSLLVALSSCLAALTSPPIERIETFQRSDAPVAVAPEMSGLFPEVTIERYTLDSLRNVQARLSTALPAEFASAKNIAVGRLAALSSLDRNAMQASVVAILRAHELGVRRYPAIVIDSTYVVYGVGRLDVALTHVCHYHQGSA